ncbi:MAG: hypothetical protein FJY91_00595 [Candidatus Harrisonbacteria bacterium]|nr:hypothetical protein [Candidatus Harrisonbacteria bacterium]
MEKIIGVAHIHSRFSYDGKLSLPELKSLFQKNNLRFALVSEHEDDFDEKKWIALVEECQKLSDDSFLFIPGLEINYAGGHVLCFGLNQPISYMKGIETLKEANKAGALIVFAHPHRSRYRVGEELQQIINGVEIWNSHYDGKWSPRFLSYKLWQKVNREDKKIFAFAGLDFHDLHHLHGPRLEVASSFSIEAILKALISGSFVIKKDEKIISAFPDLNMFPLFIKSFLSLCILGGYKFAGNIFSFFPKSWKRKIKLSLRKNL